MLEFKDVTKLAEFKLKVSSENTVLTNNRQQRTTTTPTTT
jgi:hypothetical protein